MKSDQDSLPRPRVSLWLWAAPLLLVLVALLATYFVIRQRTRDTVAAASQHARFQILANSLQEYASGHDGALPDAPDASISLSDVATGNACTYRVVTADGLRIARDPFGDRAIAWTPAPSYGGTRAVIMNDLSVRFVSETELDLTTQRVNVDGGLNRVRSKGFSPERAGNPATEDAATAPAGP